MLDQCHNVEEKIPGQIRSVLNVQEMTARASLVDTDALTAAQEGVTELGGTMRLGAYPCVVEEGSKAHEAYGATEISERHRHRYEVNNAYRETLVKHGLRLSGLSPDERLVEIVEVPTHRWFVAGQFHPELKSRPDRPHPLFREFVKAAVEYHNERGGKTDRTEGEKQDLRETRN